MKQPPKTLNILGHDYTVDVVDKVQIGEDAWGACYRDRCHMEIWSGLSESMKRDVLLHEIGHAIYFLSGINILDIRDRDEEIIVQNMSNGFFQVLKYNPKLRKFLFDE